MFEKMIISDADGAESRARSRYFLVSGLVIGVLFFSAVVVSIYAVDLNLGTDEFELSIMLAPVEPDRPEPPKEQLMPKNETQARASEAPVRNANILRVEETPVKAPDSVSVDKPTSLARPWGDFDVDPGALETVGSAAPGGSGNNRGGNNGGEPVGSSSAGTAEPSAIPAKIPDPPPVIKPKPVGPISLGVVNGKAIDLPKPPYTAAAIAVNAQGEVTVQVTIDEFGKVISAKALKGHPMLKREAEKAAYGAKFSPTKLSNVPVKVTGMIVYNFKRS